MLTASRAMPRRLLVAATGLALAAASLTVVSTPADAADSSTVTVTGTSDVYDSGLIQSVIAPDFQKATGYKLNYISEGTGKAISDAEKGVSDALIVHAPSLENAFVAGTPYDSTVVTPPAGVSYSTEAAGRAIFYGDYILAGATADPAGVDTENADTFAAHDIVKAYEDVAAAGANGNASFVSRGGTPGTTIQEHAIWALTTGVPVCTLPNTPSVGGGAVPSTTANPDGSCPDAGPTSPSWYHTTGATQGPNIVLANTCNFGSSTNNCYVFTDRGTFNYLQSGSTSQAGNLTQLVSDNDPTAPGGHTLLVNTFHAYAVNPDAVGKTLNTAGAKAFLDWLTSDAGQSVIGKYLSGDNDPPFIPDAAPNVSVAGRPTVVNGGSSTTITGSLSNEVFGTPPLSAVKVQLLGQPTSTPKAAYQPIASGTTLDDGTFSIKLTPTQNENYEITTPALPKVLEYPNLDPKYYDALQSTKTTLGTINVKGVFAAENVSTTKGHLKVTGSVDPARAGSTAHLSLYARKAGSSAAFTYRGQHALQPGRGISATFPLAKGKYNFYVTYNNAGVITRGVSATKTVTVA